MSSRHLLFLSGWGSGRDIWLPLQKELSAHPPAEQTFVFHSADWKTCLPEGNGPLPSVPPAFWEFERSAEEPLSIIAWSLGGLIALSLAIARPESIHSLVLLSPTARMCGDDDYAGAAPQTLQAMRRGLQGSRDAVLRSFARNCCLSAENETEFQSGYLEQAGRYSSEELGRGLDLLLQTDLRPFPIRTRSLLLHGDRDPIIPPSQSEALARQIGKPAERHLFPAAHNLLIPPPEGMSPLIRQFLSS